MDSEDLTLDYSSFYENTSDSCDNLICQLEGFEDDLQSNKELILNVFDKIKSGSEVEKKQLANNLHDALKGTLNLFKESVCDFYDEDPNLFQLNQQFREAINALLLIGHDFDNGRVYYFDNEKEASKKAQKKQDVIFAQQQFIKNHLPEAFVFFFEEKNPWKYFSEGFANHLKKMNDGVHNNDKFEPYYLVGVAELIRNLRNKKEHPRGFNKDIPGLEFDYFHNDYSYSSLAVLSLFGFIEILEAWAKVFPIIQRFKEELK